MKFNPLKKSEDSDFLKVILTFQNPGTKSNPEIT